MVSRFAKYCPCEQKRKFKLCEAQHVNVVEAVECWRAGCDARFDLPVLAPAMTPAAPAPRASPRGELEA
ncbi:MAG: hypothetical protein IT556_09765 [Acetobacteraceae bacterium]|nr:hypothetical protein [Acetobacteraceae bacterium]